MNDYLVFVRQIDPSASPDFWEQFVDGVLKAYQSMRPLNHERIKAFRVASLGPLAAGAAGVGPEFMQPESQREYLASSNKRPASSCRPILNLR